MPRNLFDVKGQPIPQWDTRRVVVVVDFYLW